MTIEKLLNQIEKRNKEADLALVKRAYLFAEEKHKGQKRISGDDYIVHPLESAQILFELGLDESTIAAALLHDVLEDTETNYYELRKEFGEKIAELVEGVTKLGEIDFSGPENNIPDSRMVSEIESFRKLFLAMAKDVRVVLIKLADRLHNMRTLSFKKKDGQKRIALETMEIYAPLADRLGMGQIKAELEDLSFKYLHPAEFEKILKIIESSKKEREHYLNKIKKFIKKELEKEEIKVSSIDGRIKSLYSIYKKLEKVNGDMSKIYDLMAIRVIVESLEDCYKVLGVIHKNFKPLIYRIKDYIAIPKPNGYQSLHTTVFALDGRISEIQIRTQKMHDEAEKGVAAHWYYAETKKQFAYRGKSVSAPNTNLGWVSRIINWQETLSGEEFWEALKIDIFNDRIFVFTPKGEIFELPEGATPIDFAYEVHTQLGHRCRGAKVNGRIVNLDHRLENRDLVEILVAAKNDKSGPNRNWLDFVKTSKAKQNIRSFFKKVNLKENSEAGRKLLSEELSLFGMAESDLTPEQIRDLLSEGHWKDWESVLVAIGEGSITARQVLKRIIGLKLYLEAEKVKIKNFEVSDERDSYSNLSGILVRYAACCQPVAGDEIKGFITQGQGITIHRADCRNLLASPQEKVVNIDFEIPKSSRIKILIKGENRIGFIRDVTHVISEKKININGIRNEIEDSNSKIFIDILVDNPSLVSDLLHALVKVDGVTAVKKV